MTSLNPQPSHRHSTPGLAILPILLCALLAARPAFAQRRRARESEAFCNVVSVKTERLSNATRITVNADGVLEARADAADFVEEGTSRPRVGKRFTVHLTNAKSRIGSLVDVGVYPISHLEFTIPPEAPQGIGLDLTIVLLTRGRVRRIRLYEWGRRFHGDDSGVTLDIWLQRNRRSLIITARSDRYVDVELTRREKTREVPHECRCSVNCARGRVWIDAQNVPSGQLFREISERSGLRIIQSGVVDRRMSAYLPGMPTQDALDALARAYGLCIDLFADGTYVVTDGASRAPAAYAATTTRAIPVRNIKADEAADMLPNFLARYAQPEPSRNVIVATGPEPMLDKLERDIRKIDVPAPRIEVRAIAVEGEDLHDLEAALRLRSARDATEWTTDPETADVTFHLADDLPEDLEAHLRALQETIRFRLVSRVRAVTNNGERAHLFVGDRSFFPFRTAWRWRQEVVLEQVEVGVRLFIRPITGGQGEITSFVYLRIGSIVRVDEEGLPLVSTRRVRAAVRTRDGDTIYIGGARLEQRHRAIRRIPILGDIPLVGKAFRRRILQTARQNLGFFVTLRVLAEDETRYAPPTVGAETQGG